MVKPVILTNQESDFILEMLVEKLNQEETDISPISTTSKMVMNNVINKLKNDE